MYKRQYKGWLIDTLRYWKATTDSFGIIDSNQGAKWEKYPASMMNKEYDKMCIRDRQYVATKYSFEELY